MDAWLTGTIPELLNYQAARRPDAEALVIDGRRLTYGQLHQASQRVARQLSAHGVNQQSRVAVLMEGSVEFLILHYAVLQTGAVLIPVNYNFKEDELGFVLRQSECTHLFFVDQFQDNDYFTSLYRVTDGFAASAVPNLKTVACLNRSGRDEIWQCEAILNYEELVAGDSPEQAANLVRSQEQLTGDDFCYFLFTSGSTGFPKLAQIRHRSLVGTAHHYCENLRINEDSRILAFFTLYHIGGLSFMVASSLYAGACFYTGRRFDPEAVLQTIETERISVVAFFDTHVVKLLAHPRAQQTDFSSLQSALYGGPPATYDLLHVNLGVPLVTPNYGSTESGASIALVPAKVTDEQKRKYSNGKPFSEISVKIVDPSSGRPLPAGQSGEICTKGWSVFGGYYNMPEENEVAFDDEGYFRTGDIGHLDDSGYLYYSGRYKMIIKTGGENVSEIEVENFLCDRVPNVRSARVVGVPDAVWGEAVTAFLELAPGAPELSLAELRSFCKRYIANYKVPRHVFYVKPDEWPVNAAGKVVKADLRQLAIARLQESSKSELGADRRT